MSVWLGAVADDFTGATDLADALTRGGFRVVLTMGVPTGPDAARSDSEVAFDGADAVVVALKTRNVPPAEAVAESVAALHWLRGLGAQRFWVKYCSTFDSTPAGNIGPITDAALDLLSTDTTIAVPAFPANGRTVYQGTLFVGDRRLDESGMRDHPLTPMRDPDVRRLLAAQTTRPVGHVPHKAVRAGADAVRAALRPGIAVVDTISDADLVVIAEAVAELTLVTGSSALGEYLPTAWGIPPRDGDGLPAPTGRRAVVAGSASTATRAQLQHARTAGIATFTADPEAIAAGKDVAAEAVAWAARQDGPVVVHVANDPDAVAALHARFAPGEIGGRIEAELARAAAGLVEAGVRQLVVAGGETSGAVVRELGVSALRIGPRIVPGVPWTWATTAVGGGVHLALKSGNFGGPDFVTAAFRTLDG